MTPDVYAACDELDKKGIKFQKKPDDGRMKGLAFVLGEWKCWVYIDSWHWQNNIDWIMLTAVQLAHSTLPIITTYALNV